MRRLLDADCTAQFAGGRFDAGEWLAALARLMPALTRNDVLETFSREGGRVCVVYDFVTDTAAGAVRCVELLSIVAGRVTSIELLLDRVAFAPVNAELAARASGA